MSITLKELRLWVKITIVAKVVVIKRLVRQDRRLGPDVRDTWQFSPPRMATDDVWLKSL